MDNPQQQVIDAKDYIFWRDIPQVEGEDDLRSEKIANYFKDVDNYLRKPKIFLSWGDGGISWLRHQNDLIASVKTHQPLAYEQVVQDATNKFNSRVKKALPLYQVQYLYAEKKTWLSSQERRDEIEKLLKAASTDLYDIHFGDLARYGYDDNKFKYDIMHYFNRHTVCISEISKVRLEIINIYHHTHPQRVASAFLEENNFNDLSQVINSIKEEVQIGFLISELEKKELSHLIDGEARKKIDTIKGIITKGENLGTALNDLMSMRTDVLGKIEQGLHDAKIEFEVGHLINELDKKEFTRVINEEMRKKIDTFKMSVLASSGLNIIIPELRQIHAVVLENEKNCKPIEEIVTEVLKPQFQEVVKEGSYSWTSSCNMQ